jgi:hypothetical protein
MRFGSFAHLQCSRADLAPTMGSRLSGLHPTGGWERIVVRKVGGSIWLNGVLIVASFGTNPGGLQCFVHRRAPSRRKKKPWRKPAP